MRKNTKRSAAAIAAAVIAVGGGAAAWAAWSVNATDQEAKTTAGTAAAVQVKGTSVTPTLLPGNKASVQVSVHNPNPFFVKVTGITITGITTNKTDCDENDFSIKNSAITATTLAPVTGSASAHTKPVTLTDAVSLKSDPDNACQGAALSIKFNVAAASTESAVADVNSGAGSGDPVSKP